MTTSGWRADPIQHPTAVGISIIGIAITAIRSPNLSPERARPIGGRYAHILVRAKARQVRADAPMPMVAVHLAVRRDQVVREQRGREQVARVVARAKVARRDEKVARAARRPPRGRFEHQPPPAALDAKDRPAVSVRVDDGHARVRLAVVGVTNGLLRIMCGMADSAPYLPSSTSLARMFSRRRSDSCRRTSDRANRRACRHKVSNMQAQSDGLLATRGGAGEDGAQRGEGLRRAAEDGPGAQYCGRQRGGFAAGRPSAPARPCVARLAARRRRGARPPNINLRFWPTLATLATKRPNLAAAAATE